MADLNPQTFASEKILAKLVAHFNALPAEQRTIQYNDLPVFKVQLIDNGLGDETILVGSTGNIDPSKYIGEAVYLWKGGCGPNMVATKSSFFEISKFLNPSAKIKVTTNVCSYLGSIPWEDDTNLLETNHNSGGHDFTLYLYDPGYNASVDPAGGVVVVTIGNNRYNLMGPQGVDRYVRFSMWGNETVEVVYKNVAIGSRVDVTYLSQSSGETIFLRDQELTTSTGHHIKYTTTDIV